MDQSTADAIEKCAALVAQQAILVDVLGQGNVANKTYDEQRLLRAEYEAARARLDVLRDRLRQLYR